MATRRPSRSTASPSGGAAAVVQPGGAAARGAGGQDSPMLGVLELGTNSLKLHLCSRSGDGSPPAAPTIGSPTAPPPGIHAEPLRAEWDIGFDICSTGRLSPETIDDAVSHVRALLARCQVTALEDLFGVATGVFEEAGNVSEFLDRLHSEFGIPVRVLTEAERARLLYLGFRERVSQRPALIFDLGCGRLELVHVGVGPGGTYLHESLPLGVIRIHHVASLGSAELNEEAAKRYIDVNLRGARPFSLPAIHGTGGTIRAISRLASTPRVSRAVLQRVEDEFRAHGPPQFFSPRRQAILLPGLLMVRRLLDHAGAAVVEHHRVDIGLVLTEKLRDLYRELGSKLGDVFLDREIDLLDW